jgi:hypothetical protein
MGYIILQPPWLVRDFPAMLVITRGYVYLLQRAFLSMYNIYANDGGGPVEGSTLKSGYLFY